MQRPCPPFTETLIWNPILKWLRTYLTSSNVKPIHEKNCIDWVDGKNVVFFYFLHCFTLSEFLNKKNVTLTFLIAISLRNWNRVMGRWQRPQIWWECRRKTMENDLGISNASALFDFVEHRHFDICDRFSRP